MTEDSPTDGRGDAAADSWGPSFVRVTGVRRQHFVEFDFALAADAEPEAEPENGFDQDLAVEMVLPYPEFRLFCAEHRVQMVPGSEEAALAYLALHDQPASTEEGETTG